MTPYAFKDRADGSPVSFRAVAEGTRLEADEVLVAEADVLGIHPDDMAWNKGQKKPRAMTDTEKRARDARPTIEQRIAALERGTAR